MNSLRQIAFILQEFAQTKSPNHTLTSAAVLFPTPTGHDMFFSTEGGLMLAHINSTDQKPSEALIFDPALVTLLVHEYQNIVAGDLVFDSLEDHGFGCLMRLRFKENLLPAHYCGYPRYTAAPWTELYESVLAWKEEIWASKSCGMEHVDEEELRLLGLGLSRFGKGVRHILRTKHTSRGRAALLIPQNPGENLPRIWTDAEQLGINPESDITQLVVLDSTPSLG